MLPATSATSSLQSVEFSFRTSTSWWSEPRTWRRPPSWTAWACWAWRLSTCPPWNNGPQEITTRGDDGSGKVEICGDSPKAVGAGKPWQEISPAQIERVRLMFVHFLEIMWEWCFRYLILQLYTSVRAASPGQEVSLRFKSKEQCNFLREETREEEAPRSDCVLLVFLGGMSWCKIPKKRWIDGYSGYDFPMQCVVCFPMCTPCCQRIAWRGIDHSPKQVADTFPQQCH